jgi:HAD superfamily hydrolase (TIGR01509 family)
LRKRLKTLAKFCVNQKFFHSDIIERMIKAVIFDMDGLMIDSEHLQSKSFEAVLGEYGVTPDLHGGLVQEVGVGARDNWERLKELHQLSESVEVLYDKKQRVYEELLAQGMQPMPGLMSLLDYLSERDVKKAIASSSARHHIITVIEQLQAGHHFDAIISGDQVKRGKPEPDIFLRAAEEVGIKPTECIVLEYAPTGVAAAKRAGMKVVAVPNRHIDRKLFSEADLVVDSLEELSLTTLAEL